MKRKALLFPILCLTSCLSSCSFLDLFKTDSYVEKSLVPREGDGSDQKVKILQTYKDYTENLAYNLSSSPLSGRPNLLVIPIWLSDSDSYFGINQAKDNIKEDIETAFFGSEEETGWQSVATYFEKESFGELKLGGVVSEWFEADLSSLELGADEHLELTIDLLGDAVNWYFNENPTDSRTNYDYDGDGYLDGVIMIYAAPDYRTINRNSLDNLWAYTFWEQETPSNERNPVPNVFLLASYDFMYGRGKANERVGSYYASGDTNHCNVDAHTYIHEIGHVFGLDDYYDYNDDATIPAGGFSMQDNNVGGHDPYSLMACGWADPYIPLQDCEITISPFVESHDLILLTPEWNAYDSPFDEYMLLEFYTPTGLNEFDSTYQYMNKYPKGTTASGIRLWHVDARLAHYDYHDGSWDTSRTYVDCERDFIYHATSNTTDGEGMDSYTSKLGGEYLDYDLLRLVSAYAGIYQTRDLQAQDLFRDGDSFDQQSYSSQFPKGTLLNKGVALGWEFSVEIEDDAATITLNKV